MKRPFLVSPLTALLVTGCLSPPPTPAAVGPTRLIIDVADPRGDPVTDAAVSVEGVPEEGARTRAIVATAVEEAVGRYVVAGFGFDIVGPWTITVTVTGGTGDTGVSLTRAFPISVVGGP